MPGYDKLILIAACPAWPGHRGLNANQLDSPEMCPELFRVVRRSLAVRQAVTAVIHAVTAVIQAVPSCLELSGGA